MILSHISCPIPHETEIREQDESLMDYIDTLKNLHEIDRLCNSRNLNPDYKQIIEKFTKSWLKLKQCHRTTIPNKVHIIMHHLSEYFDRFSTTLKYFSDQTIESTHQEFGKRLEAGNYDITIVTILVMEFDTVYIL